MIIDLSDWKKWLPWALLILLLVVLMANLVVVDHAKEQEEVRKSERERIMALYEEKEMLTDSIRTLENEQAAKENAVLEAQGELAAAQDGLSDAQDFHLFRSQSERESDIKFASQRIVQAQRELRNREIEVSWLQDQKFQVEKRIQHIDKQLRILKRASNEPAETE